MSARTIHLSRLPRLLGAPGGVDRSVPISGDSTDEAGPSLDPVPQEEASKIRTNPSLAHRLFDAISSESLTPACFPQITGP